MKSIPFSPCHERLLPFPSYYVAGTYALFADLDGVKGLLATSFLSPAARLLANVPSRWGHTHVLPFLLYLFFLSVWAAQALRFPCLCSRCYLTLPSNLEQLLVKPPLFTNFVVQPTIVLHGLALYVFEAAGAYSFFRSDASSEATISVIIPPSVERVVLFDSEVIEN